MILKQEKKRFTMTKKSKPVYRKQTYCRHKCSVCGKARGGCIVNKDEPETKFHKKKWICFHCNEDKMEEKNKGERKEVFTGKIERECDYCGLNRKCKVTRDGKKICENCEEHNINAQRKIKELEIFG